jgi:hypothetical protein
MPPMNCAIQYPAASASEIRRASQAPRVTPD